MAKSSNPRLPRVTLTNLITAGNAASTHFNAISTRGLLEDLGLKGSSARVEPKALKFGSPSSRSSISSYSQSSSGSVSSSLVSSYLSGVLGSSLLGSVFTGLSSLFGLGSGSSPAALARFSLSGPQSIVAAIPSSMGISPTAGHSSTRPLSVTRSRLQTGMARSMNSSAPSPLAQGNTGGFSGHQFHFHVSAMDTQSFVDRSSDIAKAVKTAMLQSNSLNDVVADI